MVSKIPKYGAGVLILTHGRADIVDTARSLRKYGYTGPIRFVVDTEDDQIERYRENFGADNVIVFDKAAVPCDVGDNLPHRRGVVYARNAVWEIARSLGWTYFIVLDDDYTQWRWIFTSSGRYTTSDRIVSLDRVFKAMVRFMETTPAVTLSMCQGGDVFGGSEAGVAGAIDLGRKGKRKAMNVFVFRVDRPVRFVGRLNEDVNTYVRWGATGDLFFATNYVRVEPAMPTQHKPGGLTGIYRDMGTYVKSFYSVLYAPSCVKVYPMQSTYPRWHHRISWRHAVPKILREKVKR